MYTLIREIPVEDGYDVVVAGGGPAGSAAAVCAARLGSKVLLVEATGCLGGMGTSGLVCAFDPMADGVRSLVGGYMREVVETMFTRGFLKPDIDPDSWRKNYHSWTPFSPEGLKLILDEFTVAAGVEVRFFTRVIDADADASSGRVRGIVINNVEGTSYIKAKAFIDATGDAVLSHLCGAAYREAGRDTDRIMPATLASLYANIDWSKERLSPQTPHGVELIEKEHALGNLSQCDRLRVGVSRVGHSIGYLNGGHIFDMNSVKIRELSDGMMKGRRIVREIERFLKKYSTNCENMELVATGSLMGLRESRRIVGEYELTYDDFKARRQFPDQIGVFNKCVDIHPYDCSREEYERFLDGKDSSGRLKIGEHFGIPYGILVPKGWSNLWVAGRCTSSDVLAHGSIRVMPACAMMGQAAGTAAVQSIKTGQPACDLDTQALVETLRAANAYLPQTELREQMSRSRTAVRRQTKGVR